MKLNSQGKEIALLAFVILYTLGINIIIFQFANRTISEIEQFIPWLNVAVGPRPSSWIMFLMLGLILGILPSLVIYKYSKNIKTTLEFLLGWTLFTSFIQPLLAFLLIGD